MDVYKSVIKKFDVAISFNWDILYEHAYRELFRKSIEPSNLGFNELILKKPALLKFHGSFNWGLCEKCGLYISDSKIAHKIFEAGMTCPYCNEKPLSAISILPALTKFENIAKTKYPPYRNMWYMGTHSLTEADKIYFVGFSLSNNDVHTRIFLKSAINNNKSDNLKICVIDKYCDDDLKERYNLAFGNKIKLEFIKESFKNIKFDN